jgi:hypothetical protein
MDPSSLPTEVILTCSWKSLGTIHLDWTPQPGAYLEVQGQTYAVLERRHQYQLKAGRYRLHKISLHVQPAERPPELSLVDGRWLVGDVNCRFNARSQLLRCAVNPVGPCGGCRFFEPRLQD